MSLETQVADLVTATNSLTGTVNTKIADIDAAKNAAVTDMNNRISTFNSTDLPAMQADVNGVIANVENIEADFGSARIGYSSDYRYRVIPLVEVDSTNTSGSSNEYTIGTVFFNRPNGCCIQADHNCTFSVQKMYSSDDTVHEASWRFMAAPTDTNTRTCTFTKNGIKYAGLHIEGEVQSHGAYFIGKTNQEHLKDALFGNTSIYYIYKDTRDNSVSDAEINDSLVIGDIITTNNG